MFSGVLHIHLQLNPANYPRLNPILRKKLSLAISSRELDVLRGVVGVCGLRLCTLAPRLSDDARRSARRRDAAGVRSWLPRRLGDAPRYPCDESWPPLLGAFSAERDGVTRAGL